MKRLRRILHDRNAQLATQVDGLVDRATPQLWHTWSTFPTGTKHTPEHTAVVEDIASMLLIDDIIAALTDDEIAMLILACHFHDLGMAGTEADNADADGRERVRREHAVSVGDRICEQWQELGFESLSYAEVLADVCRGHRPNTIDGIGNWRDLPKRRIVGPQRLVRVRLVSAMIYAADELHLGDDRAPKRDEAWSEIASTESLRHWRRHQAILGPTKDNTNICFDITIDTFAIEKDIRRALKKAFQAVESLRRELRTAEIPESVPALELLWLRDTLWRVMIVDLCRDGNERRRDVICSQVSDAFRDRLLQLESLGTYCNEYPSDEEIISQIARTVDGFATRQILVPGSDSASLRLATDTRTATHILKLARCADYTERLFAREIDASHEHGLYGSAVGKQFIREHVLPEAEKQYGVNVAAMPGDSPLRAVIEASPTACRLIQELSTPPSAVVKRELLLATAMTGMCFDLTNNPELILDRTLRDAIRSLYEESPKRLSNQLELIQEVAVIRGLTIDQVLAIITPSSAARNELVSSNDSSISMNVTQSFPVERWDWSLPYLMLAVQRSAQSIDLLNGPLTPFRISFQDDSESVSKPEGEQPELFSIAPSAGRLPPLVTLRARPKFDRENNTLTLRCETLAPQRSGDLPILVTIPPKPPVDGVANGKFRLAVTAARIADMLELKLADEAMKSSGIDVHIELLEGSRLASIRRRKDDVEFLPADLSLQKLIDLSELDAQLPFPVIYKPGMIEAVLNAAPESRREILDKANSELAAEKPVATSVKLRFAAGNGDDYYEEDLGLLQEGSHLTLAFESDSMPVDEQTELRRQIKDGKVGWKVSAFFREDTADLANELRAWVDDPSQPFPFPIDPELRPHYCKTCLEVEHSEIDRYWYFERSVLFRFRPATKSEQYGVEMKYWREKGDERRAELLSELLAKAVARESASGMPISQHISEKSAPQE